MPCSLAEYLLGVHTCCLLLHSTPPPPGYSEDSMYIKPPLSLTSYMTLFNSETQFPCLSDRSKGSTQISWNFLLNCKWLCKSLFSFTDLRRFILITCITWLKSTSTWKCSRKLLTIATAHSNASSSTTLTIPWSGPSTLPPYPSSTSIRSVSQSSSQTALIGVRTGPAVP